MFTDCKKKKKKKNSEGIQIYLSGERLMSVWKMGGELSN